MVLQIQQCDCKVCQILHFELSPNIHVKNIKTTSMEDVSTRVLEKIKNI